MNEQKLLKLLIGSLHDAAMDVHYLRKHESSWQYCINSDCMRYRNLILLAQQEIEKAHKREAKRQRAKP